MFSHALSRPLLRLLGVILLLGLLVLPSSTHGWAQGSGTSVIITQPTQGATVNGIVEFRAQGSPPNPTAPYVWYFGSFTVLDANGYEVGAQHGILPDGYLYAWDWVPPASGTYEVRFSAGLYDPSNTAHLSYTATPVQFFVGTAPPPPVHKGRVVNNGNLCGCRSGCANTRSSTLPRNGDQSWDVPVTSWSYRGWEVPFSLTYHSVGTTDPSLPDTLDLAHLSQRNSKWTHTYAQWVEVVSNAAGQLKAVWYNGGGTRAFDRVVDGVYQADDSYTGVLTGGGTLTSPSGTKVNQAWFRITDGAGTQYWFENVQWVTSGTLDFPAIA